MIRKFMVFYLVSVGVIGCATGTGGAASGGPRASLPAFTGWYANERVYYITTDISDPAMGQVIGANYTPRLRDAVSPHEKIPGERTVLERVYKFASDAQDAVFASIPRPICPKSQDAAYSPLWLMYRVEWINPAQRRELRSEDAILSAEDHHELSITRTNIVINCPIVASTSGGQMPHLILTK